MNTPDTPTDHQTWEQDVSAEFHATMNAIREESPPRESIHRALTAAIALRDSDQHAELPGDAVSLPGPATTNSLRPRSYLAVAATLLIVASIPLLLLSQRSVWAQVVQRVSQEPWMRLTIQKPDNLPAGEKVPGVTMWFSGKFHAAALQADEQRTWVDLAKGDSYQFQSKTDRLVISKINAMEDAGLQRLLTVLAPFDRKLQEAAAPSTALRQTEENEILIDGQAYIDFAFEFGKTDALPIAETLTVRVDKQTSRPVKLSIGTTNFTIDFPETGPGDIYALGVDKETAVDDLRELEPYFAPRPTPAPVDYEAIEITVIAGLEGKWINEARRYRSEDAMVTSYEANLEQVNDLASSVYFAGGDKPTGTMHEMTWWMDRASQLDFQETDSTGNNFPHNRCYGPFGRATSYRSAHASQIEGLEGTVELRGPKMSVWVDPQRDLIVRRFEHVGDDGSITVRQYDEVLQDGNGVWFVTRWRSGAVSDRGGELPTSYDRENPPSVATTVHFAKITFE